MKFEVVIKESLERTVSVEAKSKTEAIEKVLKDYQDEKIILGADDFAEMDVFINGAA